MAQRKSIDMCWEWVEQKRQSGDELYLKLDNETDGLCHIEEVAFIDDEIDPQEEAVWFCITEAVFYVTWQAYQYEKEKYVPQAIETVDDETIDNFMESLRKVSGYQEGWAERLKKYLLKHYPAGSEIKREELLSRSHKIGSSLSSQLSNDSSVKK